MIQEDKDLFRVYSSISILFDNNDERSKDPHDGFLLAQELLNHMDKIRTNYSSKMVMQRKKGK